MGRFAREESGLALTEGLIAFPIMILLIGICVEFAFMVNQWNLAAKAMQVGVRKLVVSDPVTTDFETKFGFARIGGGGLIAANAGIVSTCGAGTGSTCDGDMMDRLVDGTPGDGNFWPGLGNYFPNLTKADIRVTYELSGLGYLGRPEGAVVSVRMDIIRSAVDLPVLGVLLDLSGLSFPPFTVSTTSEDLSG